VVASNQTVLDRPPEDFRRLLSAWRLRHTLGSVSFTESSSPTNDRFDDYTVVFEATFLPEEIDQPRLELWLTSNGLVAVGLDTTRRVAERYNVSGGGDAFAAGHEPRAISDRGIIALLDAVSAGRFFIRIGASLLGLGATSAAMTLGDREQLKLAGYEDLDWIGVIRANEIQASRGLLPLRAWV
jgi:hypothetical protein